MAGLMGSTALRDALSALRGAGKHDEADALQAAVVDGYGPHALVDALREVSASNEAMKSAVSDLTRQVSDASRTSAAAADTASRLTERLAEIEERRIALEERQAAASDTRASLAYTHVWGPLVAAVAAVIAAAAALVR